MLLYEELLLLALDNKKGKILFSASSALPFSLMGAIIAELYLHGKISIIEKKLVFIDRQQTGILILDEVLEKIAQQNKNKSMEYWIENLVNSIDNLQEKIFEHLIQLGIVQKEEHKFLFIPYYRYPEYDTRPEHDLMAKLNQVVQEISIPDTHSHLLLVLIKTCNLINTVFEKQFRKTAKNLFKVLVAEKSATSSITIFAANLNKSINSAIAASTAAATSTIISH